MSEKPLPNHISPLLDLVAAKKVLQQPGLHHIRVAHDDWCNVMKGKRPCNCNPDVSYIATEGRQ